MLDVSGTFEGTSDGHRKQLVGSILAHSKGLSSFFVDDNRGSRSCIRRRHRGSYDLCIEGTMMICFEGNGARIPLRSRDMTIFEFVRQRERITLRGACVKECVDF